MQWIRNSLVACSVAAAAWSVGARAQEQLAMAAPPAEPSSGEHELGRYMGVKLGGEQAPPGPLKPGKAVAVTWPGFQMRPDGGSCVFLQTTAPLSVHPVKSERKWIVDLGEVRVEATNRLALDTTYFNTPVTRVALKRTRGHTQLELSMRADVEPRVALSQAKNGYHFLSLDFAPGQYLPADLQRVASANVAPPPPPSARGANLDSGASSDEAGHRARTDLAFEASAAQVTPELRAQIDAAAASEAELAAELNAELPPGMAPTKAPSRQSGVRASGKISR